LTFIAVDIGATNIRVATGNMDGLGAKLSEHTDTQNGPDGVSQQIIRMIEALDAEEIQAIGIGSIGPISLSTGEITNTPNYPFNYIPVVGPLKEHFGVRTTIVNDCAAAVLGEQTFGAGKGLENIVYVTMSTGLGGGAIVDDHLLMGKDGNAVEVGHITIDANSKTRCGCGGYGHWEAFCGGKNLPKHAAKIIKKDSWRRSLMADMTGGDLSKITTKTIFDAAKQGDEVALRVVEEVGRINAVGFANIVNAYDPELITIGGSIALNNPEMILEPIHQHIDRYLLNRRPEIMVTPLGADIVLMGALALGFESN
jgi:glucokinase